MATARPGPEPTVWPNASHSRWVSSVQSSRCQRPFPSVSMTANRRSSMARSLRVSGPPGSAPIDIGPPAAAAMRCRLRSAARPELPAIAVTARIATTTAIDSQAGMCTAQRTPLSCRASRISLPPMKAQTTASPVFR